MRFLLRLLSVVVIVISLMLGLLFVLPGEKVAALAAAQIEAQTGRKLSFGGKVKFTIWPVLGIKSDGVSLSNADWAGPEPMLTAQRLSIGISASDLLRGKLRVTEVSALLPRLNLSEREDGLGNWVLTTEGESGGNPEAVPEENKDAVLPVAIEKLTLTGAALRYQPREGAAIEMRSIDMSLKWPDPSGTVNMDLVLRPAGEPVNIAAEIGTFSRFLAGDVVSMGASVDATGGFMRFDGRADLNGAATGRMTAKTSDTARFLSILGLSDVALPAGLGQSITLGADMTYTTDGRLALRDMALDLDGNQLEGALDLATTEPLQFTVQLNADDLDFGNLVDAGSAAAEPDAAASSQAAGWSKEAFDASPLALANGTAILSFNSMKAQGYELGASQFSLKLDRSRAVLELQPARVFGGTLQGQLVANNRSGFSTGGKLTFRDIHLGQALSQSAGYDRLNGEALGEFELLASGSSVDALMRSLSGKGWLEVGRGFFSGFDLEGLMRSGKGNGGSTVFDQLSGSFAIEQGNLQNPDLLVTLKGIRADGKGRVGIGAQDLDYLFTPSLGASGQGRVLSIPVAITGPWSDPKIRPDLQQALQPEIDALEDQLKERALQELGEELDAEITPEQDLNEVIRDRIEQEAKDQLLKFLQGN
ncbi:AsmA family protein [Roseobacter sp. SK209-2-6]|uniref:AsmA family protein n=1 Tax=Roseobacter sp. SK209-2-6 TaxID=388739 RepID=UPI0000F3D66E|nr:AsmA-like C-terminal region-containing protein [Roseobacter sp. SK209-2-6]EBA15876.1 AsmA family protein [Roseobacter sp. SK209-2-6]